MLTKKRLNEISANLYVEPDNFMRSFRNNLFLFGAEKDLSLEETSKLSGVSVSTLRSLLYENHKDCNLSTAIKLAKMFEISIDELVGAGTLIPAQKESMAMLRLMPARFTIFIRWLIRKNFRSADDETVVLPKCNYEYLTTLVKEDI